MISSLIYYLILIIIIMEISVKEKMDAMSQEFLTSDKTFQSSVYSSQAILTGFEDVVEGIGLELVVGANVTKRTTEQIIGGVKVAGANESSYSYAIKFKSGRTVALSALIASPKSLVGSIKGVDMKGTDWGSLVGKTLKCTFAGEDESIKIPRRKRGSSDPNELEDRHPRYYTFSVTGS